MARSLLASSSALKGLLLGTTLVAAIGLATIVVPTLKSPGGCTSSSQCPPAFVCVKGKCVLSTGQCSRNTDCPTGYVCQSGVCVKSCGLTAACACGQCAPTNCTCGQCWSQADCQCEPLTVSNAQVVSFIPVNQGWASRSNPGIFGGFHFQTGQDPSGYQVSCAATPPSIGAATQAITLTGSAVDTAGHPICNVPITINALNPGPIQWISNDSNWLGTLRFGFNSPFGPGPLVSSTTTVTAADGSFSVAMFAQIQLDVQTGSNLSLNCSFPLNNCSNPASYTNVITLPITYTTPNNVQVQQLIYYQTRICCFNS